MKRLLIAALSGLTLLMAGPALASAPVGFVAHSALRASDPAAGAQLTTAPKRVNLTFNEVIKNFEPVLAVLGPDGKHLEGEPVVSGTELNTEVADGGPGVYTVAFRIISADGHPINGQFSFSVGSASAPALSPAADGGVAGWVWAVGGLLVGAVIIGGFVVVRRRKIRQ